MKNKLFFVVFILFIFSNINSVAQKRVPMIQGSTVFVFGAVGDSITDDTEAIQKAVDSGIGKIIFNSGTYRIISTIEIDLDKVGPVSLFGDGTARILMTGSGPAFRLIGTHAGTAGPATVRGNVWMNQRMPLIDGLEIVGRHPESVGIEASGTMKLTITRLLIREALHGIRLFNRNRNVIISECHIYNNDGIGIYLDDVDLHQINIAGSHVIHNKGGGIVVRNGSVRNLQIGTCDIESNMDPNGPPTANLLIDQSQGTMREGTITGCTVQHDRNISGSANIRFIGNSSGLKVTGNFTVSNNHLSDTRINLDIQHGRSIIVIGNTFRGGSGYNILIEESSNIYIGPNLFDNVPDYGTTDNKDLILIRDSEDLSLNGLHLNNNGGDTLISLERCKNYNLINSTILNFQGTGIFLKDTSEGKISGNFIRSNANGAKSPASIKVKGGNDNLINNNFTNGTIDISAGAGENIGNYLY